ncbi:MAG TPA: hypothetical protein VD864_11615 [Nocardioides sp.]|nr:hypothetical protein [Nocardioides sp.]
MPERLSVRPRDLTDLYLAPLLIALEERLEQLAPLNPGALAFEIILVTNQEPRDRAERAGMVIEVLQTGLDLHGWTLSLEPRGLRVEHAGRGVVLGLPTNLRDYLVG